MCGGLLTDGNLDTGSRNAGSAAEATDAAHRGPSPLCLAVTERNMMHRLLATLMGLAALGPAQSQSGFWRDPEGKPVAETESMRSVEDFAGSLVVTTDEDWQKKWNSPPEVKPSFTTPGVIAYGKKVFVLTFFANPKLDGSGRADVRCDFRMSDPTGKATLAQKDATCFAGRITGNPYNLYLSAPVIAFSADPGDPPGTWVIEVTLRDTIRGVELPLRTTFALK